MERTVSYRIRVFDDPRKWDKLHLYRKRTWPKIPRTCPPRGLISDIILADIRSTRNDAKSDEDLKIDRMMLDYVDVLKKGEAARAREKRANDRKKIAEQRAEDRKRKAEDRERKAEDRKRKAEERKMKAEEKKQKAMIAAVRKQPPRAAKTLKV